MFDLGNYSFILICKLSHFDQQVLGYKSVLFALNINSDDQAACK